jgi:hypothetical protein
MSVPASEPVQKDTTCLLVAWCVALLWWYLSCTARRVDFDQCLDLVLTQLPFAGCGGNRQPAAGRSPFGLN